MLRSPLSILHTSRILLLSIPYIRMSTSTSTPPTQPTQSASGPSKWPTSPYTPRHSTWPYSPHDFERHDLTPDTSFYTAPRFVTHIDDHAIQVLKEYYEDVIPKKGRILDLCSSWTSHFPSTLEAAAKSTAISIARSTAEGQGQKGNEGVTLEVIGIGMNAAELEKNPVLSRRIVQDLNTNPTLPSMGGQIDTATCVVSMDYLIHPVQVLSSIYDQLKTGGVVHLIISNRCFPTKVVGRWLKVTEEERLEMVGDYLWFAGYRNMEVVTLSGGGGGLAARMGFEGVDPLWVVRGTKA